MCIIALQKKIRKKIDFNNYNVLIRKHRVLVQFGFLKINMFLNYILKILFFSDQNINKTITSTVS